jgi:DNA-binding response OmpR family regulator
MESAQAAVTVLVADPDPASQQIIVECLQPRYHVLTARTIAETLDKIATYNPRVLLLELNQPDGDGSQLIHHLRADRQTRSLIIGCVTSRGSINDKIAGFQAGADDYVVKPINKRTFMWRVVLLTRVHRV